MAPSSGLAGPAGGCCPLGLLDPAGVCNHPAAQRALLRWALIHGVSVQALYVAKAEGRNRHVLA